MKVGDYVECVRSGDGSLYSVGNYYEVEGLIGQNMLLRDDKGDLDDIPIPMQGGVWGFAPVQVSTETLSLLKLLKQSEEDVKSGRIMTRDQLMESLSKD